MPQWLINMVKNFLFKEVSGAWESEKDKPLLERKRTLGAGVVALSGLYAVVTSQQVDPVLINQLVTSVIALQDAIKQIVNVIVQSKPLIAMAYGSALFIVGLFNKKIRDNIAKILGEPKQATDAAKTK